MATFGSSHVQSRSGRALTFWAAYLVQETDLCYVAVINDGLALVGQHEATLRFDPSGIPASAVVRLNVSMHIDRTLFGEGRLPDPRWIGWYGPYRQPVTPGPHRTPQSALSAPSRPPAIVEVAERRAQHPDPTRSVLLSILR